MKAQKIFAVFGILFLGISSMSYGQEKGRGSSKLSAGILTGYNRGYSLQANLGYLNNELPFELRGGLDYYFPSTLHGHDTSYSPDNDNVNPRNDNENNDEPFVYKDADEAIGQPRFMPFALIGLRLNL